MDQSLLKGTILICFTKGSDGNSSVISAIPSVKQVTSFKQVTSVKIGMFLLIRSNPLGDYFFRSHLSGSLVIFGIMNIWAVRMVVST